MALMLAGMGVLLAWLGGGRPLHSAWALASSIPILFGLGAAFRRPWMVSLGFVGLLALAGAWALAGRALLAVGVVGLALLAWDSLSWSRLLPEQKRRGLREIFDLSRWSWLAIGLGVGLAVGASFLRVSLGFWGLVGLVLLFAVLLWAWIHTSLGDHGGKARGNRWTSAPQNRPDPKSRGNSHPQR
jgi:hypothetical protein